MWYFSWILGVGLACSFAILNAMWFELREDRRVSEQNVESLRRQPHGSCPNGQKSPNAGAG
jgi:cyd operon protein YbgT